MATRQTSLIVGLLAVSALACSPTSPASSGASAAANDQTAMATAPSNATHGIVFVKHNLEPNEPFWVGREPGTLQVIHGCLFITSDGGESLIAIWPPSYTLSASQPPAVVAADGSSVLVGDHAWFFGGELDATVRGDLLDKLLGQQGRPASCGSDHYWVVTGFDKA